MALLEKETQKTLLGVGIGVGAMLAIRYAAPVIAAVARPFTKALIASVMEGFEIATHRLATAAEAFQDLVAEVRADRASSPPAPSVVSASGTHEVN
jgi:hypothetical protein